MSSILASQVEVTETKEVTNTPLKETLADLAAMFSMYAVTATIVVLLSLQWVA